MILLKQLYSYVLAHLCPILIILACNGCTEGMMRCLGRNENQCCSWFLNDRCVQFCPAPLVGNPDTFDCGELVCLFVCMFIASLSILFTYTKPMGHGYIDCGL